MEKGRKEVYYMVRNEKVSGNEEMNLFFYNRVVFLFFNLIFKIMVVWKLYFKWSRNRKYWFIVGFVLEGLVGVWFFVIFFVIGSDGVFEIIWCFLRGVFW